MRDLKLYFLLFLISSICRSQQESNFSYYMFNHQAINPAYTGSRGITNLTSVIRSQWVGLEGAPETQTITFGKSINSKNLGYGVSVLNDKIGPTNSTSFDIDLAYHLKLNEKGHRLSLGLKAGAQNYSLNTNIIQTLTPNDPAFVLEKDRKILPNIGFGIYYFTQSFYSGFAIPRLLSDKEYNLEPHYYFITGGLIKVSEVFMLKPSFLLKQTRSIGGYDFSILGIINENIWIGGQIRSSFNNYGFTNFQGTGISALAGFQIFDNLTIGYSYGIPSNEISNGISIPTHEVFLRLDIFSKGEAFLFSPRFF
tara:strand:- start:893 stop:1822 length:930 start_codon:yes stop_codon:yes gene_type:complete